MLIPCALKVDSQLSFVISIILMLKLVEPQKFLLNLYPLYPQLFCYLCWTLVVNIFYIIIIHGSSTPPPQF
jgi:hypothetical protein